MMQAPLIAGDDPAEALLDLINGFRISQAIYVVTALDIPDLLADAERSTHELAALTRCHRTALYRVLRALAAVGIFAETGTDVFALTPLGAGLRKHADCSRHAWVKLALAPAHWAAWGELLHGVQTGDNPFRHTHGQDVWKYRASHPAESEIFDRAMRERSAWLGRRLPSHYDFQQFTRIADIGGGDGSLLANLLPRCPAATGLLLDLPHVVANASHVLEGAEIGGRCEILAGDFLEGVPAGADAYLLKHILHDWDDAEALTILRNCRKAMEGRAKLLVIERLIGPPNEGVEGKLSDLNMLVNAGGRERTQKEFAALLGAAGFAVTAFVPLPTSNHLIEAAPR
jgi:hypothetical protein